MLRVPNKVSNTTNGTKFGVLSNKISQPKVGNFHHWNSEISRFDKQFLGHHLVIEMVLKLYQIWYTETPIWGILLYQISSKKSHGKIVNETTKVWKIFQSKSVLLPFFLFKRFAQWNQPQFDSFLKPRFYKHLISSWWSMDIKIFEVKHPTTS